MLARTEGLAVAASIESGELRGEALARAPETSQTGPPVASRSARLNPTRARNPFASVRLAHRGARSAAQIRIWPRLSRKAGRAVQPTLSFGRAAPPRAGGDAGYGEERPRRRRLWVTGLFKDLLEGSFPDLYPERARASPSPGGRGRGEGGGYGGATEEAPDTTNEPEPEPRG